MIVEVGGVIDEHYASLSLQGVQHVFVPDVPPDGRPSSYQPSPTGLNSGEQMRMDISL